MAPDPQKDTVPESGGNPASFGGLMQLDDIELSFRGASESVRRSFLTLIVEPKEGARGGLGKIAKVRSATGKLMACKQMIVPNRDAFPAEGSYEAEFSNREKAYREEYETLCKLSNFKGFMKAYGYGHIDGVPVILMEWIEGLPLSKAIPLLSNGDEKGRVHPLIVAQIGRDVFRLLARLEWQTELFVHRDISPANIMIRTSSQPIESQIQQGEFDVCFIDFGSAASMRASDGTFTTVTRILRGATPDYAPPEMLSNDLPGLVELRKSSKIDVYATCSVLYQLLCGHVPYNLASKYSSDYLHKMQNPPLPMGLEPGSVEDLLGSIILKGLAATQDPRPNSYSMYKMLEYYIEHFDENVKLHERGQELTSLNPKRIGKPDIEFEQVSFSKPLSKQVVEDAMEASEPRSQALQAFQTNVLPNRVLPTPAYQAGVSTPNNQQGYWQASQPQPGAMQKGITPQTQQRGYMPQSQQGRFASQPNQQVNALQPPHANVSPQAQYLSPAPRMQMGGAGQLQNGRAGVSPYPTQMPSYTPSPSTSVPQKKKAGGIVLKVLGLVALFVLVFAAAFFIATNVLSQSGGQEASPSAASASASGESSSGSATAVTKEEASSKFVNWTGTWKGSVQTTSANYSCYGAKDYELVLSIGELTSSNKAPLGVQVLYHGHDRSQLKKDIESSTLDYYLTLENLKTTIADGSFSIEVEDASVLGRGNSVVIQVAVSKGSAEDPEELEAVVQSNYGSSETADTYKLVKQ